MPRILVADPLAEDGLERLRRAGEVTVVSKLGEAELIRRIPDFDALVVRSETRVTAPIIEAGSKLRVVGRAGVGVDNIDVGAATRRGILVVNAPRGNIVAAAEHAIALLFSLARWVPQADASVKRGEWTRAKFIGTEIRGKTLGVIGLGNVGSEVAKRAHGLEMDVVAYDPVVSIERPSIRPAGGRGRGRVRSRAARRKSAARTAELHRHSPHRRVDARSAGVSRV